MLEVVALMEVPDGEHMLLQNIKIVGSSQGNVLGVEEKAPSTVFPMKTAHTITLSWYFTVLTVDSESYLDDPGDLLTNLDPPLTSLKVLSPEIITVYILQMSNTSKHCRTRASSSSWVKL